MPHNLLLTGLPGCGKTTVVEKVVAALPSDTAGGFVTHELREGGRRVGFEVHTLDGRHATLAHVSIRSRHRVGRYRVDVRAFEEVGVRALEEALAARRLIVIDEIGKMELFSEHFRQAVLNALDAAQPMLATITYRPHPWCDRIKAREDLEIWTVTRSNRDVLPDRVLDWLRGQAPTL
ncbi:MAG: NTPase [Anaerolineae bacterium]|nr:NTPase [Anaerolineae bacterium]